MKKLLFILAVLFSVSCSTRRETEDLLDDVMTYIEVRPDSALVVLEGISTESLSARKQVARHALLYSMALDKNYVDLQSDSIIAPAVVYYRNHGSADEKLLTYYYRGRIAMNAGQYEDAISYFVRAERYAEDAQNDIAIARLYKAETKVFQYCYDTQGMIKYADQAAVHYLKADDTTRYLNSVNDLISAYLMRQDTLNTRKYLEILKDNWDILSISHKSMYYSGLLFLNEDTGTLGVDSIIHQYYSEIPSQHMINWLTVADAYISVSNFKKAYEALEKYIQYGGQVTSSYLWIYGRVSQELGYHVIAMESYQKCLEMNSDRNGYLFSTDVRFIEERYSNQIQTLRKNHLLVIISLCALILGLLILLAILKIKQISIEKLKIEEERRKTQIEKDDYIRMYNETLAEIDELKQSLKVTRLNPKVRYHISERLTVLNKFIAANISANYSQTAMKELNQLMMNKDQFIESTRLTFYITYPKFLDYLKKQHLSDNEIGYCCLYAIGLKGKDISHYIGANGQYKFNGDIRSKLGLSSHDTNLDIYLRNLLEKLS